MFKRHLSFISLLLIVNKVIGNGITGVRVPENVACNAFKLCPLKCKYKKNIYCLN